MLIMACFAVSSCNTTSRMEIPQVETTQEAVDVADIEKPLNEQASFALMKLRSGVKRGTVIFHYPAGNIEGTDGSLCNLNYKYPIAEKEQMGPGGILGNWSTELGEIFTMP